jgi:hypothetical protein
MTIIFVFTTSTVAFAIACGSTASSESSGEASSPVIWSDAQDRWVMEPTACPAGWTYSYIDNSCHHAANNGVDAGNDGIFSCRGVTSGPYGHTINWDIPADGTVCLAEPQLPNSPACCWDDPSAHAGGSAVPPFSSPEAQACVAKLCGTQYIDGGGTALDAGETWPVAYLDCAGNNSTVAACKACCDTNADQIPSEWGDAAINDRENYRAACKAACAGGRPTPPPPGPPSPVATVPVYQPPPPTPSPSPSGSGSPAPGP